MCRGVRNALTAFVIATATIVLVGRSTAAIEGLGQAAAAPPTSAQIAPFVGNWLVTMAMNAFQATFVVTVKDDGGKITATVTSDMRRELGSMSTETRKQALQSDDVRDVGRRLDTARDRTRKWKPHRRGFRALEPGLEAAFRRARRALADARETPNDETYHTWRKRVKTHWYQIRLLEEIDPKSMKRYAGRLKRLERLLGDDHNLTVLKSCLDRVHVLRERPDARAELDASIVNLQSQLRTQAHAIGAEMYGAKPAAFARTLERGWSRWRKGRPGYSIPSARAMM